MQPRARVIGIGSPFGDDVVGWRVAEAVEQSALLQPYLSNDLEVILSDRPGVKLINQMDGLEAVLIVDAVVSGSRIGTIHCFDAGDILENKSALSVHGFGLAAALELARALNVLPPRIVIIGIEICSEYKTEISPEIAESIREVVKQIEESLLLWL